MSTRDQRISPEHLAALITLASKIVGQPVSDVATANFLTVAQLESGFDPFARSKVGSAKGLFQFIDSTASRLRARVFARVTAFVADRHRFDDLSNREQAELSAALDQLRAPHEFWVYQPLLACVFALLYVQSISTTTSKGDRLHVDTSDVVQLRCVWLLPRLWAFVARSAHDFEVGSEKVSALLGPKLFAIVRTQLPVGVTENTTLTELIIHSDERLAARSSKFSPCIARAKQHGAIDYLS